MSKYYDLDKLKELIEAKAETLIGDGATAFHAVGKWLDFLPAADVAIHEAVIIPRNATNGDVIKAMFPDLEWIGMSGDVDFYLLDSETPYSAKLNTFKSWWNKPYRAESEGKE